MYRLLAFCTWWYLTTGLALSVLAQQSTDYTRYLTGDSSDVQKIPLGGIGLLGGAEESDEGMRWWLERAQGGDIVVLRASGADGYHDYFYKELGVRIHSIETFVCRNRNASYDPYLLKRLSEAEAVWIAGGDQWNYYSFWKNTPVDTLLQQLLEQKHIAIGGTSAGMAILAGIIFTAEKGTTTTPIALSDPFDSTVCLSPTPLLKVPYMQAVITDTHYDARERNGRHMAFLARALHLHGNPVFGIACEESTMVCIDPEGKARVFGQYPAKNHYAYFLQTRMLSNPEICHAQQALEWWNHGAAVYTYRIPGTPEGGNYLSLVDWKLGKGGRWEKWAVRNKKLERDTTGINAPEWRNTFLQDSNFWLRIRSVKKKNSILQWESGVLLKEQHLQIRNKNNDAVVFQTIIQGRNGMIPVPPLKAGNYRVLILDPKPREIGFFSEER